MDSVRNRRDRMRLFHCLKPPTVDDYEETVTLSHDRYERGRRNNKNKPRQSLSSGLKAVFINSFLGKKFRTNKSRKLDSCQPSSDIAGLRKHKTKKKKKSSCSEFSDAEQVFTSSNSSRTGSTRSSRSSNSVGSERYLYIDSKEFNKQLFESTAETSQPMQVGRKFVCVNSIRIWCMFMLAVCLFALVFGGKPFAILTCTSSCLFFAPRSKRVSPDLLLVADQVTDLNEYKKRVIMEGMLDRNRASPAS